MIQDAEYKPLNCRHCGRQLALATPQRLLFNMGCCCDEPVALRCSTCGARRYWRPERATLDAPLVVDYTDGVPA